jgi:YHS domain-containing protein
VAYTHTNSKGVTYFLNSKNVTLRGGKQQTIYYFSKDKRAETIDAVPAGFVVNENPRNGFLTVKRANK